MYNKTKILMCRPDYFDVSYYINPWMKPSNIVNSELAAEQYGNLVEAISRYAKIEWIKGVNKLPDMVFTANAGLLVQDRVFVVSNFLNKERQQEQKHWKKWFSKNGYVVVELPPEVHFEGAGDALWGEAKLFVGHGFRTDKKAINMLRETFTEIEIIDLELCDPNFYHLDTCFCPVGNGSVIVYPEAFKKESYAKIEETFSHLIELDPQEALNFSANSVVIDDVIIMNKASESLIEILSENEYKVIEVELSEFMKSGGSAKCLTLKLNNYKE